MKIGFCTPGGMDFEDYKGGNLLGIESQVFGLAQELTKIGHEVYVFRRWHHQNIKIEVIEGINIVNIKSFNLPDRIIQNVMTKTIFSYFVKKEIEKFGMDLLILTEIFSSYFISNTKIPKIYVTHNPPSGFFSDLEVNYGILKTKFIKDFVETKIFDNSDIIVALNTSIKNFLDFSGYHVVHVPNGIHVNNYSKLYDSKYILTVGRLIKLKGIEYLIEAYSKLDVSLKDNYKLVIVGNGPEEKKLKKIAKRLKVGENIDFINWLSKDELIKKMGGCSVLVFPSLFETFGIVLIEAMASGKPTIASDIPAFNDIITNNKDGLFFQKKNVEELKKSLEYILTNEDERERIGKNARTTIEKNYDFNHLAQEYIKIFNTIMRRS